MSLLAYWQSARLQEHLLDFSRLVQAELICIPCCCSPGSDLSSPLSLPIVFCNTHLKFLPHKTPYRACHPEQKEPCNAPSPASWSCFLGVSAFPQVSQSRILTKNCRAWSVSSFPLLEESCVFQHYTGPSSRVPKGSQLPLQTRTPGLSRGWVTTVWNTILPPGTKQQPGFPKHWAILVAAVGVQHWESQGLSISILL